MSRLGRLASTTILSAACLLLWRFAVTPTLFIATLATVFASAWAIAFMWSTASRRIKIFSLIAVHLGLFGLVLAMEIPVLLGWIDYRLVFHTHSFFFPTRDPGYLLDPELGYLPPPGLHQQGRTPGNIAVLFRVPDARTYSYDVHYDARGFRNQEALTHADVALVGDSFVHGVFVPQEQLSSSVLAGLLGDSVYNLGQLAYGPQQEAAIVRRFALPLHPHTVVWVFYEGNDLADITAFHEFENDYEAAIQKRHNFLARSFTRNFFATLGTLAGKTRESAVPRSAVWSHGDSSEVVYFLEPSHEMNAAEEREIKEFQDLIAPVARASERANAHLVLAFAPTKYRVLHDQIAASTGSEVAHWHLSDLPQRLRHLVEDLPAHVQFVDLTPALVEQASHGRLPFFPDDTHWSPPGHEAVAHALADFIDTQHLR